MKKILITGGAGYIGSHTNKLLSTKGYETIVYDNLVYGHRKNVKWGEFILGDLNDKDQLELVFKHNDIDAVIHFAAYAYVGESIYEPEKYYINNVGNTINLLSVMRKYNVNKIVFSSTCATYGEPMQIPITEEHVQNPINPYGQTKYMIEKMLEAYDDAYGLKYIALRYFNAAGADLDCEIGEEHSPETHLIPLVLDVAKGKRESISVYGTDYETKDGTCIRDYIHVNDLADAHVRALEYLNMNGKSQRINLGNETGTSVKEIIEAVERVTGKSIKTVYSSRREGDPAKLVGSNKKAKELLGWNPKLDNIEVIIRTAWNYHKIID